MNKNMQIKVILIFFVLGVILISGLGIGYLTMLHQLEAVNSSQPDIMNLINSQVKNTKIAMTIAFVIYSIVSVLVGILASKILSSPMKKLIKSAEKVASEENINELNRQKKQIETILLHMTDGIIAFDMQGEIIHINLAAKSLLSITDKEDTFDKIY